MKWLIFGVITAIFILAGTFVPFVNTEYGLASNDDYGQISTVSSSVEESSLLSLGSVLLSITSMFFWTFGAIPFWLDAVFLVFRFVFWGIVVDTLWIG